jgi:hypothetical protein
MGSCLAKVKCGDPTFVEVNYQKKTKIIRRSQFLKFKNMEQFIRYTGFFPIARIVSMKTDDRGVFPWDSPMIYPNLEIYIEDIYGIKKTYTVQMIAMYRK